MDADLGVAALAIHRRLLADRPTAGASPGTEEIVALVRQEHPLLATAQVQALVRAVAARMYGLGPLDPLLGDPTVADILVNGPGPVWVERAGRLVRSEVTLDRATIDLLVERMLGPLGRQADPVRPVVEGRLHDGSRVQVVVPPVAVDGPCVAIRRFGSRPIPLADLAPPAAVDLLRWAVRARWNVVVVGGTGAGKTTLLNALAQLLPGGERVITVEDAAELRLGTDHVVRLETRPASAEGTPVVSCRDLVRTALRMRPDRLIVGEVRGAEALDMVQAMSTGHDGSLATLHANSAEDAVRRLELLVLLAGIGLPLEAVSRQLAAAVDAVVAIERLADGRRVVTEIAELLPPGAAGVGRATRTLVLGGRDVAAPRRQPRAPGVRPVDGRKVDS